MSSTWCLSPVLSSVEQSTTTLLQWLFESKNLYADMAIFLDREDRDKDIEHHKNDSVNKAKTGQGEWKPELGSNSEQAVRGDKHNMTMEQMQKLGQERANEDKNPGGSDSSKGSHQA
jgi:hypothetical protein